MLKKDFPLVSKQSISTVDCMSTPVLALEFCKKKEVANPYLARASVNDKNVKCISSKKINLRYLCKKRDPICKTSKFACNELRKKLASRLVVDTHYEVLNTKSQKEVICYFVPEKIKPL